jgi:hypothetical protein
LCATAVEGWELVADDQQRNLLAYSKRCLHSSTAKTSSISVMSSGVAKLE